jgi:hypothetical protein
MSKFDKRTQLVIDGQGNCIMDGVIMSVNDAMKQYIEGKSKVLVFDNHEIEVASGLPPTLLEKNRNQFDITRIDTSKIEDIIRDQIQGVSTLKNEGMKLFTELDKQSPQDKGQGVAAGGQAAAAGGQAEPAGGQAAVAGGQAAVAGGQAAAAGGQAEPKLTLIAFQQKIDELRTKTEQALRANPQDEVNTELNRELEALQLRLSEPGFIDKMITEFRRPFEVMVRQSGVIEDIKRKFGFVYHAMDGGSINQTEIDNFNNDLYDCLMTMMSARDFYRLLAFTAIYKDSWVKLCFGVSCTIFELQLAFTIANSIIFKVSLGTLDANTIITALHTAYNACTRENVITLLQSLGFTSESASQIYNKLSELTIEQMKFALQILVFKKLAGCIKLAENPQGAPPAPLPPFTLAELMGNPIGCIRYLQHMLPSIDHFVAGPPEYSLENRAITSFQDVMQVFFQNMQTRLRIVYPNDAPVKIKGILFELLLDLDLSDKHTPHAMDSALAMLQYRLYTCLEKLYITKNVQPDTFNDICRQICPGLCLGLRESLVLAVFDDPTDSIGSSLSVAATESPLLDRLNSIDGEDRPWMIVSALTALKSNAIRFFRDTERWVASFMPEQERPPSATPVQPLNRGHALAEFIELLQDIKTSDKLNKKYKKSLVPVFDAFKNSVHFDEDGNLKVSETDYDIQMRNFKLLMTSLTEIAKNVKGLNLEILDTIAKFIQASALEYEDECHLLVKFPFMFPGNTEALQHASFSEVDRITNMLNEMIQQAEIAISNIQPDSSGSSRNMSNSDSDSLGGRSRSRKHSVSKRTRRKGVAKKEKSKKNKRQSRRKVRRASSRKLRK